MIARQNRNCTFDPNLNSPGWKCNPPNGPCYPLKWICDRFDNQCPGDDWDENGGCDLFGKYIGFIEKESNNEKLKYTSYNNTLKNSRHWM